MAEKEIKLSSVTTIPPHEWAWLNTTGWLYQIINKNGLVYLGATTNLKRKLQMHSSKSNTTSTRGHKWHLLAANQCGNYYEAINKKMAMKANNDKKQKWKATCLERAEIISKRYNYKIDFANSRYWKRIIEWKGVIENKKPPN